LRGSQSDSPAFDAIIKAAGAAEEAEATDEAKAAAAAQPGVAFLAETGVSRSEVA
jgi:hypothetical protein